MRQSTKLKSWSVRRIGLQLKLPPFAFVILREFHGQLRSGWATIKHFRGMKSSFDHPEDIT